MTNIQPNGNGKVQQAKKQLRRHLKQLKNAGNLTAGQRDLLFAEVLSDLTRIQLHTLGQSNREDTP
jgi:hypothetical protein